MGDRSWKDLCEAIMQEGDPQKLMTLVDELNRALDQRESELRRNHTTKLPEQS
jgi:hypothetical protein